MSEQLSLRVNLRDDATFDNFLDGENIQLVAELKNLLQPDVTERLYYLWGKSGVGRSHLLQACCHHAGEAELTAAYLPLAELCELSPDMLVDLETMDFLCIDDIDSIAGLPAWEEALFHLYNRVLATNTRFIVTAAQPPRELRLALADLHSRLAACMVFQLHGLGDAEKIQALQLRAKYRGLQLSDAVGQFLLQRFPRDMHELFSVLDKLIQHSLQTQKHLTVSLVRSVFSSGTSATK